MPRHKGISKYQMRRDYQAKQFEIKRRQTLITFKLTTHGGLDELARNLEEMYDMLQRAGLEVEVTKVEEMD